MTVEDPLWDDRASTDDTLRRPGETAGAHAHRIIDQARQQLEAKRIPPGKRPRAAYSEPVTE